MSCQTPPMKYHTKVGKSLTGLPPPGFVETEPKAATTAAVLVTEPVMVQTTAVTPAAIPVTVETPVALVSSRASGEVLHESIEVASSSSSDQDNIPLIVDFGDEQPAVVAEVSKETELEE